MRASIDEGNKVTAVEHPDCGVSAPSVDTPPTTRHGGALLSSCLVFSPGWGGPAWFHTSVGPRLASHGFVVAVIYHFGDQAWAWEPPYDHLAIAYWNRPRDMSFVLTELLNRNQTSGDLLHGLLMPDKIAAS